MDLISCRISLSESELHLTGNLAGSECMDGGGTIIQPSVHSRASAVQCSGWRDDVGLGVGGDDDALLGSPLLQLLVLPHPTYL